MENQTINLTSLICDTLNTIFFKIFSSIDHTVYQTLDHVLFIDSNIVNNFKFQQIFGNDASSGLLLITNSLVFGIVLFYIFNFTISHLTYSKVDSPFQFLYKSIIFIACMNSSLWICENIIWLISTISNCICQIGSSINGCEINFSNLLMTINSSLYQSIETFDIFSFDGLLKFCSTILIGYIMMVYSVRFLLCKLFILLSPFAFLSLICNRFDGFFKSWFKNFIMLLCMQIFISLTLVLGFSLDFYSNDIFSKLLYISILIIISKCNYTIKELFSNLHHYSKNKLKHFI